MYQKRRGFTLIEVIVILGIVATLVAMGVIGSLSFRSASTLRTTAITLQSDLANQQIKAMTGDTEGRSSADTYGIFFAPSSYTLFHGSVYNPSDSTNFTVQLGEELALATTYPNSQLIFTKASGEPVTSPNPATIIIRDTNNTLQYTLTLNRFGVITSAVEQQQP